MDNVGNNEGVSGSSKSWETDFWHYYDYTTENCIINDYHATVMGNTSYFMSGESELLAHKSAESRRTLDLLAGTLSELIPFKNDIKYLHIQINDFYQKFWESIETYLTPDDETLGELSRIIYAAKDSTTSKRGVINKLESNLYLAFLYGAMKFEYVERTNFSVQSSSSALAETLNIFTSTVNTTNSHKQNLKTFLKKSQFANKLTIDLFIKIQKAINFIFKEKDIIKYDSDFSIPADNHKVFKKLLSIFYDGFVIENEEDRRNRIFHIFTIEFNGLSSGEKNLLSMFGRIAEASKTMPSSQKEITFLLDEPEVTLHPQWQTKFISLINNILPKLFPQKELQIIISSHSPILISDLPKDYILFLEKDKKTGHSKVSNLLDITNTFGANIHSLYSDAFFLKEKGGAMGEFAKEIILSIIRELNNTVPENPVYIKSIIDQVGEPLIKNQLLELFYRRFPEQRIESIDERIKFLEQQLANANKIKASENHRPNL